MRIRRTWLHLAATVAVTAIVSLAAPWGIGVAMTAAAVCAWTFVGLYVTRSNWRAETIGKVMVLTNVFLACVLTQAALSQWTDRDYPYREHVRIIMHSALAYGIVWKIVILLRAQRNPPPDR
ncbi:putative phage holin [Mycobacteroides abscessus]|uniref:putative phage holin n=1 Tax=Mycobacteroides abscessus TaxID=36809 RepID=UPI0009283E5E|nr:hypothetical protein [Mycobacteroides abscessus]OTR12586.1 hypothetical protein B9M83_01345 [Mycobacteroides abscessus]OTR19119.1 hypothetical protein B9M82_01265 [Mycobacteroides abscessus]SIH59164.1 Uncharacterised protein [Mycobacteroides abscessus subsp. abscessus]SIN10494.1 Uncharacterised protein [Mycobacteroides abscessus subsp. abscessus]SIN11827.1 Uncharacterised protein [Mycobacteroides abscessus subsp. abscessus]